MDKMHAPLDTLNEIRQMMERSSRFISLSGWSGIAAGATALVGAWLAHSRLALYNTGSVVDYRGYATPHESVARDLLYIAAGVFIVALVTAFVFTYFRSRKAGIMIWGTAARRLLLNTSIPMIAGAFVVLRMYILHQYALIAACCLIFYGLALVNGSKYTLGEVRYLGYGQIILGLFSLWLPGYGLLFWAAGFGLLHIIYGILMWWKYER